MFKAGDRVRVVSGVTDILPQGKVFTVSNISNGFVFLTNNTPTGGWLTSRFELVKEEDMTKNYPTDLTVGDVLVTNTGREYTVAAVDGNYVHYAYIPAKYDYSSVKKLAVDKRRFSELEWVDEVRDSRGEKIWPRSTYTLGEAVKGRTSGRRGIVTNEDPLEVWWVGNSHSVKELPNFIERE